MTGNHPTPARIATFKDDLTSVDRALGFFKDAIRETNDNQIIEHFETPISLIAQIIAHEAAGNTQYLANDLATVRSQLRRLKLEDYDVDIEMISRSGLAVRGVRGNLIDAIDTALESAAAMNMVPSHQAGAAVIVTGDRADEYLIRLDERLRQVERDVGDLSREVAAVDAANPSSVTQNSLLNVHVGAIKTEVTAARFETKIASDNNTSVGVDFNALLRSVDAMRTIGTDLKNATIAFRGRMTNTVSMMAARLSKATQRSYAGVRTIVRALAQRDKKAKAAQQPSNPANEPSIPSPDFDLDEARFMILHGQEPPLAWRPFIGRLSFINEDSFSNLVPLRNLTGLQTLDLDGTGVIDVSALGGLTGLQTLDLRGTGVSDVSALGGLTGLQTLDLSGTGVIDVSALGGLTGLQKLYLSGTGVSDVSALGGLTGLQKLYLSGTGVSDVSALGGLTGLQVFDLSGTGVSDVSALGGLTGLRYLYLYKTHVSKDGIKKLCEALPECDILS